MHIATILVYLICIILKARCFTPNCVPENQFKFYEFPVEACSEIFTDKCEFHPKGYFKSIGDAQLVKIKETDLLPTCAFFNAESLQLIYGVRSKIKVLATGAFMNLPNLKAIYLAFNQIQEVRNGIFQNISANILDLSWNKISFIDTQAFGEVKNLKHLNLSKNFLVTVPLNSLSTHLRSLNLAHNLLNRIILNSRKFEQLTHVNLSNNAINKVAISMEFPVESMDFSNNRLENFDYLDIQSVQVFKIGRNLFKDVPQYLENLNANKIDIYPNPWKCEKLFLLWQQLVSLNIRLAPRDVGTGSLPECINTDGVETLKQTNNELKSCVDDHDCPSSMTCRAKRCWDPCKESLCHNSSLCETIQHQFTCSCPTGFLSNPIDIYAECKRVDCFASSHCGTGASCLDNKCIMVQQTLPPEIWTVPMPMPDEELPEESPWWFEEIPRKVPPTPK